VARKRLSATSNPLWAAGLAGWPAAVAWAVALARMVIVEATAVRSLGQLLVMTARQQLIGPAGGGGS
jgi:hypothetical protein